MKRHVGLLALVASAVLAASAFADKAPAKPVTISGEVVDTGCYLGHAAKGEKHKECAAKCISGGMPIGLLTAKGKLYLLTPNHDNPDAYNKAKDMASSMVAVTGKVMERNGMSAIDVTDIKPAPVSTTK